MADPGRQDFRDAGQLAASILASSADAAVRTTLKTDERVIARVTDGIYRQPGSALRELISNAYDADATRVVIKTDAPRFERISVEDDGRGMKPEALARLLLHIGGSAKRGRDGFALGITARDDPTRSPGGRRLIGKIGIGLFSISQLTHTFQIITKVKGDDHRTIATVALRQHSDDDFIAGSDGERFEAGQVNIWREPAADLDAQGTTVVMLAIRTQTRNTLRSREIWDIVERSESPDGAGDRAIDPPRFHTGRVDSQNDALLKPVDRQLSALPWSPGDSPEDAFMKLVGCVWDESSKRPNQKLDTLFDYYLRMVWQLSLAVPLPYVEGHPFDLESGGWAEAFLLSNQPGGAAEAIPAGGTLRQALGLTDVTADNFEVLFDDLKLARPIRFKGLPMGENALKRPHFCRPMPRGVPARRARAQRRAAGVRGVPVLDAESGARRAPGFAGSHSRVERYALRPHVHALSNLRS
ncbi:MAG: ATP-binding protein [Candidatus Competibacteraceae bacterium]|nr:ATP-binding protein [Candidatus Competibacteraceae bacterium]